MTDNETGLVWLANASCFGSLDWHEAMEVVANLGDLVNSEVCSILSANECDCGLRDGSSPGEWRLPSASEWKAMIEAADGMGCSPTITNDAGTACWDQDCVDAGSCSFYNVPLSWHWSSSSYVPDATKAWFAGLVNGPVDYSGKVNPGSVWPVRGGQ